jgi:hypothetical protein
MRVRTGELPAQADSAGAVRRLLAGGAPVSSLARHAGAKLLLVDAGLADPDLGEGVIALRGDDRAFRLQAGIAFVLSLAKEGLDLLALGLLGTGEAAAETLGGMCLAAAAIRVPVVATAAALRHAPEAAAYVIDASALVKLAGDDGSAAAAALPLVDAAARLAREVV